MAALAGWLRARQQHGQWLVRVEDIDAPREVAGSASSILTTLGHCGLKPDAAPLYQSTRDAAYQQALLALRRAGHAFPCWCSRADLEASGTLHRDGRCVGVPRRDRAPAWRLRAPDLEIRFDDVLQGPQRQNARTAVGDFVLKRADGLWGYQLACVVDDAYQRITEVVRGADLLDSTPRQILLQRLLGLSSPAYLHLPLVVDAAGQKVAKSTGAAGVDLAGPRVALTQALRLLGQRIPEADDIASMLRSAAANFDLALLYGRRTVSADTGDTAAAEWRRRAPRSSHRD